MPESQWRQGPLGDLLRQAAPALKWILAFSAALNVLILTPSIYTMQTIDRVLSARRFETLVVITLLAIAAFAAYGVIDWARARILASIGEWLDRTLRRRVLDAGLRGRLAGSDAADAGLRDLQSLRLFFSGRTAAALCDAPFAVLFLVALALLDVRLGLFGVLCAVFVLGLAALGEVRSRAGHEELQKEQLALQRWCVEAFEQAEAGRALGMRGRIIAAFERRSGQADAAQARLASRLDRVAAVARAGRQMVQIGIIAAATAIALGGGLSSGAAVMSAILLARALAPFDHLISGWRQVASTRLALARLGGILDRFRPPAVPMTLPESSASLEAVRITHRHPGSRASFILQDVSFELSSGEQLGVIGASGSGKSTLCRVLANIAASELGEVRLSGARYDRWEADALGSRIGYLPQDVRLLPSTVSEAISRLSPLPDPDAVFRAAREAGAVDMIRSLPQGFDTPIGHGGIPLSGGQRQRIALARALFGDPLLVILDEPESHLDRAGELALKASLASLRARGAMVVMVAHRPSALASMDRILVLAAGKVQRYGGRDDVLKTVVPFRPPGVRTGDGAASEQP